MKTTISFLAIALLSGCGTRLDTYPPMSNKEVRREVKACKATGMVPELVKEQGRIVLVECRLPEQPKAPCQYHYYSDPESSRQPSGGDEVEGCQATQARIPTKQTP